MNDTFTQLDHTMYTVHQRIFLKVNLDKTYSPCQINESCDKQIDARKDLKPNLIREKYEIPM